MALWPFEAKSPIDPESRAWVHRRMKWLADEFGTNSWRAAKAIEPTEKFFPDRFDGSESAARIMADRICGFMGVDPNRIVLQSYSEGLSGEQAHQLRLEGRTKGSAGHYRVEGKEIVGIEASKLTDPLALAATIAHELAHVRLLGEGRLTGKEEDHEPVTDLATVFFGMGIFNANSSFRFKQWAQAGWHGWNASKIGYLDEKMFGYALGLWTVMRNEPKPTWAKHLSTNPRAYMKQTVRYLRANSPAVF